ncbi:complement C3-like [Notolabrus celidotus]|uniref:complement C3-like n=1 Tax=Notolabrus celidotus TaxID=1203425 RepID=UPI00149062C1|nr:complement C3-like [Notolabrus celidotus]
MRRTLLLLLASLALQADAAPLEVMSAPNLLRVGTAENIFVECQDCTGADVRVEIHVMSHPKKDRVLSSTTLTLTGSNDFQALAQITVSPGDLSWDPYKKQFVYLQAQFPQRLLEHVVLVSFQSGYIFIQTDQTLYTPDSQVHYRIFTVTPRMEPVMTDEFLQTYDAIDVEIVTPEGITLESNTFPVQKSGLHSGDYRLSEIVSPGLWKVLAKFQSSPQHSFSAEFEVKEYVLPSFEVKLTPVSPFFYVDSQDFTVNIKASYPFGEEVDGTAYVLFGVVQDGQKRGFSRSIQTVPIHGGAGEVILKREHITKDFDDIGHLIGSSIFVAVSLLTDSGGEMVEAELKNIKIVTSPYTITFKKTPRYYKPGTPFYVSAEVVNPDGTPAQGVPVVINPGNLQENTLANGMVRLPVSTQAGTSRGQITFLARTNDPKIASNRQAMATMQADPYSSKSNSFMYIKVDTAEGKLGENLKMFLFPRRHDNAHSDITCLILSRGQLVKTGRFQDRGQVLISLLIPITKEMLPSFRVVAYFHTNDNEVVSDSVWVDVKDSCTGTLRLEPSRPAPSYKPNRVFGVKVTGDPGATVGLVMVDKGVHVLNNEHRLTQKKVWDIVETFDTGCTRGGGEDGMGVFYDAGLLFQSSASGTPYRLESKCPDLTRRKRSSGEGTYTDSDEIISRSRFHVSWLWMDLHLPACPPNNPNCDSTSVVKNFILADSSTTWQVIGISLSRTHGICVGEPLEVKVRKDFFIDLRLPYSAVRGEQLEVKAVLHNYSPVLAIVRVDLLETEHVCSAASKQGRHRQEVKVGPHSNQFVPFIITPTKNGRHSIVVKAAVRNSSLSDGVMKILHVVPKGVLTKAEMSVSLDPARKGVGGKQEETMNSFIPKNHIVPNSLTRTYLYVTGRRDSAPLEDAISGNSMGTLIFLPSGSGEENMMSMTLTTIATTYLDKTNQWETVGFQKRDEAIKHIKTGYNQELKYRKRDGSFAVFPNHQSSTWLTACVVKVFAMVYNLVQVDRNVICAAVKFIILNTQQADGAFREIGRVTHGDMIGDVRGTDSDASMTAFCLIAMHESRTLCSDIVHSLPNSIDKAAAYLENRLPSLTNPYAVAMTSYALANEFKLNQEVLYRFASPDRSHWPVPKGQIYTLEATAYALLALVKTKAFEDARPVVRWLNQQQKVGGGYGSTQATMMVYQAVAEHWASANDPEYDLKVTIALSGRARPDYFNFNIENHSITRTIKTSSINVDANVTATGTGKATVKMVSLYYAPLREQSRDCQKFNLSVQLIPEITDDNEQTYRLRIDVMYKDTKHDATLSILDISLLTGFIVNTQDLDNMSQGPARTIANYDMNTVLSERGSLIIYLDKVSHTQPEEITFRIHQKFKVGVLQPAAVSVYEYYDPESPCVKFYRPERKTKQPHCTNDECICIGETCSMQKKGHINTDERNAKACESTSQTSFVFKVRVERLTEGSSSDVYTMRVLEALKEESHDVGPQGKIRTFLSVPHCRESLGLRTGNTYLIMGTSTDIHRHDKDQLFQYVLSESTWIEYWPTEAECQVEEHRPSCLGLDELSQMLIFFGCLL